MMMYTDPNHIKITDPITNELIEKEALAPEEFYTLLEKYVK